MVIVISELIASDIPILQELFLTVRKKAFYWLDKKELQLEDFEKETAGEYILVAKCDNKVAGFISIWRSASFIHHLYIKDEYQRIGVGMALLQYVKNEFPGTLRLKCLKKNQTALAFYKKNGFKETEDGISEDGEFTVFEYVK